MCCSLPSPQHPDKDPGLVSVFDPQDAAINTVDRRVIVNTQCIEFHVGMSLNVIHQSASKKTTYLNELDSHPLHSTWSTSEFLYEEEDLRSSSVSLGCTGRLHNICCRWIPCGGSSHCPDVRSTTGRHYRPL